jgi:hypothetical protein
MDVDAVEERDGNFVSHLEGSIPWQQPIALLNSTIQFFATARVSAHTVNKPAKADVACEL